MSEHAFVDAPAASSNSSASVPPHLGLPAMSVGAVDRVAEVFTLARLEDRFVETVGFEVTSEYVEMFWLPVLGPSAVWLLRHASRRTACGPYVVDSQVLGKCLGVGGSGRRSALRKTLERLVGFSAATADGRDTWRLRTHLSPLPRRHLHRLPAELRDLHADPSAHARPT